MKTLKNRIIHKYLSQNASDVTISKGKRLFKYNELEVVKIDLQNARAAIKVRSESSYKKFYQVDISNFNAENIKTACHCAYDWGGLCKHIIAGLFEIDKILTENKISYTTYNPADSTIRMPLLDEALIVLEGDKEDWKQAKQIASRNKVKIMSSQNQKVECAIELRQQVFNLTLTRQGKNDIHTSCTCDYKNSPLCLHKMAALLQLLYSKGPKAFEFMRNWDEEKNKLLAEYGYSLGDNISDKFSFKLNSNAKLQLILVDKSLHKISDYQQWNKLNLNLFQKKKIFEQEFVKQEQDESVLAYAISFDDSSFPDIRIIPLTGKIKNKTGKLSNFVPVRDSLSSESDKEFDVEYYRIFHHKKKIETEGIIQYI